MSKQHRLHLHVCHQLDLETDAVDACAQHSDASVLRKRSYELVGGDKADGMRHPTELQRLSASELGATYGIGYKLLKRWCKGYTGGGLRNDSLAAPIGMHTQPHHRAGVGVPGDKPTDGLSVPAAGPSSSVTTSPAPSLRIAQHDSFLDVAALALTAKVPNPRNKRAMVPGTAVTPHQAMLLRRNYLGPAEELPGDVAPKIISLDVGSSSPAPTLDDTTLALLLQGGN